MWSKIAEDFWVNLKVKVSYLQIKNKFQKLENKLKDTKDYNNKSGNGRKDFMYMNEMEGCIGDKANIVPRFVLNSMEVSESVECVSGESSESGASVTVSGESKKSHICKKGKRKSDVLYESIEELRRERREREAAGLALIEKHHKEKLDLVRSVVDMFQCHFKK